MCNNRQKITLKLDAETYCCNTHKQLALAEKNKILNLRDNLRFMVLSQSTKFLNE